MIKAARSPKVFKALLVLLAATQVARGQGGTPAQVEPRTLTLDLRIQSGTSPKDILTAVADLDVGDDGTIYALQPDQRVIRVFARNGQLRGDIGREGGGPGEFRWPMTIGWKYDSLWVWDPTQLRVSLFANGAFARSLRVGTIGSARLLRDGSIAIKRYAEDVRPIAQGRAHAIPVLRYSADGRLLDTIAKIESVIVEPMTIPIGSATIRAPQPFADAPLWAASPIGDGFVLVDRKVPAKGEQARFRITKLSSSGDTIFSKSFPYIARRLTSDMVDRVVDLWLTRLNSSSTTGRRNASAARESIRRAIDQPASLPPVSAVVLASDGSVWVRREDDGVELSVLWTVVDAHGGSSRSVLAPKQLQILRATEKFVWGVEKDEDEVPSIVRYKIR